MGSGGSPVKDLILYDGYGSLSRGWTTVRSNGASVSFFNTNFIEVSFNEPDISDITIAVNVPEDISKYTRLKMQFDMGFSYVYERYFLLPKKHLSDLRIAIMLEGTDEDTRLQVYEMKSGYADSARRTEYIWAATALGKIRIYKIWLEP